MVNKTLRSNTNTIVGGFTDGGRFNFSRRKYTRSVLVANVISSGFPGGTRGKTRFNINFYDEDASESIFMIMTPWSSLYNMTTRISSES